MGETAATTNVFVTEIAASAWSAPRIARVRGNPASRSTQKGRATIW